MVNFDPMKKLPQLFENNRKWSESIQKTDPGFFQRLSKQQNPRYLWIGCSDSRVSANQICGLDPGEMFVHRNVANLVIHTDFNCLSVVHFAVEVLKVTDIIVCGHYGCGGISSAMKSESLGLIDNWLRNIKDVYFKHIQEMEKLNSNPELQLNRLCELSVMSQVSNLCHTTIVQDAWRRNQNLTIHGWVYGLNNGLLKDLNLCVSSIEQISEIFRMNS